MVYQDPGRALNPTMRIGAQLSEIFRLTGLDRGEAQRHAAAMLERVRIADAASVLERYPHELSGGMQQRVVIGMALAHDPALLVLDEPTTGLDATVEAEILDLIRELRRERSAAILFITHDLSVIAEMCDRVGVLYAGTLIEHGPTSEVFGAPRHPYTVGLLRCLPRAGITKSHGRIDSIGGFPPPPGMRITGCLFAPRCALAQETCRALDPPWQQVGAHASRCHYAERACSLPHATSDGGPAASLLNRTGLPRLRVQAVSKTYGGRREPIRVLKNVSFALWPGETLGLVGESGSGKTTLARVLLGLTTADRGSALELDGEPLNTGSMARRPEQRRALQIVFQNPDSALNRSRRVRDQLARALSRLGAFAGAELRSRLLELAQSVRLPQVYLALRPSRLSGGLKQRVAIALAFAGNPRVVVCDEPTSALDVSVQAAILNLLAELQRTRGVSFLYISHDLASVRYLADRIAVLYLGTLMEIGPAERIFEGPNHPYTAALIAALPSLERAGSDPSARLAGEIPSVIRRPGGCVFHPRCPRKLGAVCEQEEPPVRSGTEAGHEIRCHLPLEDLAGQVRIR
jgi:peptide/nickel transport system ATP-binding protein